MKYAIIESLDGELDIIETDTLQCIRTYNTLEEAKQAIRDLQEAD